MLNIYVESTIRPPQKATGKAMYIAEFVSDKNPESFVTREGYAEFGETTEDAAILTILIEALLILNKPCTIRIFTKAKGILSTLESRRYETWQGQKWLKSNKESVKNAHLWDIVAHALEKHDWTVTDEDHSYREYMRSELKKWQRA